MLNRLFIFFVFVGFTVFSQEITVLTNCDTSSFKSLEKPEITFGTTGCQIGRNRVYYFTSYKEFSDYKLSLKVEPSNCYPEFNNFNFKKYNMLLLEYDYDRSSTKSFSSEIRFKDGKYYVLIRHVYNPLGESLLLSDYFHKCIYLPKENCKSIPEIIYCQIKTN